MKRIVAGIVVVVIVGCVNCLPSHAGDEVQDARVLKGESSYETYCTPCHGAGGALGSAKFPGTKLHTALLHRGVRSDGELQVLGDAVFEEILRRSERASEASRLSAATGYG